MADKRKSVGFANNGKDARRRTLIIQSPKKREALLDDSLLIENEDAVEKKKNRKSLVLTSFNSKTPSLLSSPRSTMKPLSTAPRLDSDQLQQHYSDCIKLSTENKINAKNAFGLHLLEYIETIISEKSDNFQVVGCTIDAGAKIYAGRVDAVHSDMLKMVGSITADAAAVSSSQGSHNDDSMVQQGEDEEVGKKKKKKKSLCEGRTIEKNLANIRQSFYDLSFDVDPLLQKSARQSDEQCSAALISYNTPMKNGQLLFDSSAVLYTDTESSAPSPSVDMELLTLPSSLSVPFSATLPTSQESCTGGGLVEPVVPGIEAMEEEEMGDDDMGGCSDQSDIEDTQPPQKMTIDQLALALEPSEFGYFNPRLANMWAGPAHWKLKPVSSSKEKGERKKKVVVVHAFNQTPDDLLKHFIKSRAKTTLANETIRSNQLSSNILPVDIRYEESNLRRVSMLPLWRGRFAPSAEKIVSSGGGGEGDKSWYNYENPHDTSNYCPNTAEESDSDGVEFGDIERHGAVIGGIELIEAAPAVERIHINYAKKAKKIDIKMLKGAMWGNLSMKSDSIKAGVVEIEKKTFSQTYKKLPNALSESVAENLSVPIAFSCLLHLANEHGLALLDKKDLSDIHISLS